MNSPLKLKETDMSSIHDNNLFLAFIKGNARSRGVILPSSDIVYFRGLSMTYFWRLTDWHSKCEEIRIRLHYKKESLFCHNRVS